MILYSRCSTNIILLTISGITFADVLNVTAKINRKNVFKMVRKYEIL